MCGIAGLVALTPREEIRNSLFRAREIQAHRGPDAWGQWQHKVGRWQVGLEHQRLAIIDMSPMANQPFFFGEKGCVIFNGEVYNYPEIRSQLRSLGYEFRSHSDTEVLLTALHHWGAEEALTRFNGMWALAWLDLERGRLILARDRVGVKPLYYHLGREGLFFASEIKTVLEMLPYRVGLNGAVISRYLVQSLLDSTCETCFAGVQQVPPGTMVSIDLNELQIKMMFHTYWQLEIREAESGDEGELIEEIRELFVDAIRLRLRSDVPIGVLLSGGIDSSAIAAAVARLIGECREVKLLSAVSRDPRFDESSFIDQMGQYLCWPPYKVSLDLEVDNLLEGLGQVCWFNDEPVGSFSNVAHYFLMKRAKELGVTVILSGQGADELLCGYRKYLGFYLRYLLSIGQQRHALALFMSFLRQGTVLKQFSRAEGRRYLPSIFQAQHMDLRGEALAGFPMEFLGLTPGMSVQERQKLDIQRFSVPVLLHYEDRMSMAWSREIRVPFLDYRLVEKLVSLPVNLKLHQGWTKWIFRQAMQPYLPPAITWRKDKQGFVNPQSEWMKHELRPGVSAYFSPDSLIFKYDLVDRKKLLYAYEGYCRQAAGKGKFWFKDVFNSLALEIWLRRYERYIA